MSTLSVKEALAKVLREMREMSPKQLRVELDAHSNGSLAVALREAQEFLAEPYLFHGHFMNQIDSLIERDLSIETFKRELERLEEILAANDNSYALAA